MICEETFFEYIDMMYDPPHNKVFQVFFELEIDDDVLWSKGDFFEFVADGLFVSISKSGEMINEKDSCIW